MQLSLTTYETSKGQNISLTCNKLGNKLQQTQMTLSIIRQALWRKPLKLILQEEEQEEIQRTLGLFDLLMIGIGGTVGSGVFSTAGLVRFNRFTFLSSSYFNVDCKFLCWSCCHSQLDYRWNWLYLQWHVFHGTFNHRTILRFDLRILLLCAW